MLYDYFMRKPIGNVPWFDNNMSNKPYHINGCQFAKKSNDNCILAVGSSSNEFKVFEKLNNSSKPFGSNESIEDTYNTSWSVKNLQKSLNCIDMNHNCDSLAIGSSDNNIYILNSKRLT